MPPIFHLSYQSMERLNCEPWQWYTLDNFTDDGFDPSDAQEWLDADVSPDQAKHFKRLGMTPTDAWTWQMVPEAVQSFVDGGFTPDEAWDWADYEILGHEAMFWRYTDYTPEQASALRSVTEPVTQCVLWALTGLSAVDALDHATHGANPIDFLLEPELEGPGDHA